MPSTRRSSGRGTTYPNRSAPRCSQRRANSDNNDASVVDRQVRFTEQFFDRLDLGLPSERGADGTPSITDFLLFDLPRVRDDLVADYEANTLATDDPDVRLFIGAGLLVSRYAIYVALEDDVIEAFWIAIELHHSDDGLG